MINPFPYQQRAIDEFYSKIGNNKSLLIQAMTGAGKTVIAAFICKKWIDEKRGKILITCHREELVSQCIDTLRGIGISCQAFTARSRIKHDFVDVHVAMIETVHKRISKDKFNTDGITLVISDECHVLVHQKVFSFFPSAKILGFTATPVVMKKIKFFKCKLCGQEYNDNGSCHGEDLEEWTKPFTMSSIYDDIIIGPPPKELIEFGQIVPEVTFNKKYTNLDSLKVDSTGDYTTASLDEAYGSESSAFNVVLNYKELCYGKRTLIFNPSTRVNKIIYEKFIEAGIQNVRMYDSVNSKGVNRNDLVTWFKNTPNAVLLNCGVFTTGFDCKEIEALILNRATLSLSLFMQIVGRAGRSSQKIYKQDFILIDGGENVERFGEWSSDRDWKDIFFNGIGKPRAKKIDAIDIQNCENCGAYFPKNENICTECGTEVEPPSPGKFKEKSQEEGNEILQPIKKIPPPNAKHIYEYTKRQGENINFAYKILYSRIRDMFLYYRVTKEKYEKTKMNGKLESKLRKMIYPVYFHLMKQDDIQTGAHRTLEYVVSKSKETLEKYYYNGY